MKKIEIVISRLTVLLVFAFLLSSCESQESSIKKEVTYFENSNIKEINYSEKTLKDGVSASFHPNGILKSLYYYVEDKVILMNSFYDNGQLMIKGNSIDNKQEGEWLYYYYDGQLWKKGSFKNGKEMGTWIQYFEDGTIETKIKYDEFGEKTIIIDNQIVETPE